jgi:hypothetical protein
VAKIKKEDEDPAGGYLFKRPVTFCFAIEPTSIDKNTKAEASKLALMLRNVTTVSLNAYTVSGVPGVVWWPMHIFHLRMYV